MRSAKLYLLSCLCLSLSSWTWAAPIEPEIRLLPQLCVITSAKPECAIQLKVEVQGVQQAQQLCLHTAEQQLSCQRHQPGAVTRFDLQITTSQNLELYLKTAEGQLLANSTLQLVQYQEVHKRHQRSYLWNML